jgi:hypothetical protein
LILQQPPYDGKQYGRKPVPVVVIFSPDDVVIRSMVQRLQFGSKFGNACGDVWVLEENHGAKIGLVFWLASSTTSMVLME